MPIKRRYFSRFVGTVIVVVVVVVVVTATPARADTPKSVPPSAPTSVTPAPSSPDRLGEARLHFQQGVALFQERNYDAALAEFEGAYRASPEPVVLYNTGLTYKALFRYGEAVDTLERYLTESDARGQPVAQERRAEVKQIIGEMRSLLADVTVAVKPANAVVRVDGRQVNLGIEGIVRLSPGTHVIDASADEHVLDKREIRVVAGTPQTVSFSLAQIPRTGRVRIAASQIGARVSIDGQDRGPAPVQADLLAGGHQIEVAAPGFAPNRSELVVAVGQSREVTIVLEAPPVAQDGGPLYKQWWLWTGIGAAAAAATATWLLWPDPTEGPVTGTLGTTNTNL